MINKQVILNCMCNTFWSFSSRNIRKPPDEFYVADCFWHLSLSIGTFLEFWVLPTLDTKNFDTLLLNSEKKRELKHLLLYINLSNW
jgi:hypothetical protein